MITKLFIPLKNLSFSTRNRFLYHRSHVYLPYFIYKYCGPFRSIYCMKRLYQEEKPHEAIPAALNNIEVTFIKASGEKIVARGKKGDSLLDVVVNNSLDFDGFGACEGTLTCSTCHVMLETEDYNRLPEKPSEEEMDMLDLAFELTDTSRLGCQIILSDELNGLTVKLPRTINDARAADS